MNLGETCSNLHEEELYDEQDWDEAEFEAAIKEAEANYEADEQNTVSENLPSLLLPSLQATSTVGISCQVCGSLSLDNQLLTVFDEPVCRNCKRENEKFKLMSKTKAKDLFLLGDYDFKSLKFIQLSNPKKIG